MEQFINDLTDFSRNARLEVAHEEFDLKQVVDDVINSYLYLDNTENIDITIDIGHENGKVTSDRFRMRMILANLLSNAINFSDRRKESSTITVKSWADNNGSFFLEVADNGIGIAKEHLGKIFNMFYRANDGTKGSGLGLYIVKETVEKLNGDIEVASEYLKGTTFTLKFPN